MATAKPAILSLIADVIRYRSGWKLTNLPARADHLPFLAAIDPRSIEKLLQISHLLKAQVIGMPQAKAIPAYSRSRTMIETVSIAKSGRAGIQFKGRG